MADVRSQNGSHRAPLLGLGRLEVPEFGVLWLTWTERGLASISWTDPSAAATRAGTSRARGSDSAPVAESAEVPSSYRSLLEDYFAGRDVDPASLPVDLRGTPFQLRVWQALRRIPRGTVRSYGQIATEVGSPRGAQAVGAANKANRLPIVVPCHRVVETGMRLGGYSGGLERKRKLLALEGVRSVVDVVHPGQLELL